MRTNPESSPLEVKPYIFSIDLATGDVVLTFDLKPDHSIVGVPEYLAREVIGAAKIVKEIHGASGDSIALHFDPAFSLQVFSRLAAAGFTDAVLAEELALPTLSNLEDGKTAQFKEAMLARHTILASVARLGLPVGGKSVLVASHQDLADLSKNLASAAKAEADRVSEINGERAANLVAHQSRRLIEDDGRRTVISPSRAEQIFGRGVTIPDPTMKSFVAGEQQTNGSFEDIGIVYVDAQTSHAVDAATYPEVESVQARITGAQFMSPDGSKRPVEALVVFKSTEAAREYLPGVYLLREIVEQEAELKRLKEDLEKMAKGQKVVEKGANPDELKTQLANQIKELEIRIENQKDAASKIFRGKIHLPLEIRQAESELSTLKGLTPEAAAQYKDLPAQIATLEEKVKSMKRARENVARLLLEAEENLRLLSSSVRCRVLRVFEPGSKDPLTDLMPNSEFAVPVAAFGSIRHHPERSQPSPLVARPGSAGVTPVSDFLSPTAFGQPALTAGQG